MSIEEGRGGMIVAWIPMTPSRNNSWSRPDDKEGTRGASPTGSDSGTKVDRAMAKRRRMRLVWSVSNLEEGMTENPCYVSEAKDCERVHTARLANVIIRIVIPAVISVKSGFASLRDCLRSPRDFCPGGVGEMRARAAEHAQNAMRDATDVPRSSVI